jgi:hypothetical protein
VVFRGGTLTLRRRDASRSPSQAQQRRHLDD